MVLAVVGVVVRSVDLNSGLFGVMLAKELLSGFVVHDNPSCQVGADLAEEEDLIENWEPEFHQRFNIGVVIATANPHLKNFLGFL